MRKVLVFGLTFSLAGASLYACSDGTDTTDDTSGPDSATPDGKSSPTFGDTFVPDSKVTGEDDSSTGTDTGPKDAGKDADAAVDASDSGVVLPPGADKFMVVRVGVAGGALTTASAPVFVEERKMTDGTVTTTLDMPIAAAAAQAAFTLRGTGTTEGNLALSSDNAYLMLAGYNTPPATLAVATTPAATVQRVVARIDNANAIDTSTILGTTEFDTGAPRAVASNDGANFWVTGEGGILGTTGGIHYVGFGTTTGGTQIFSDLTNLRAGGIFGGQLYGSTQSGATTRLFSVGTGMPTTSGQTATTVPGYPADGTTEPNGFVFLDLDPMVAGVDTLYIADQDTLVKGGGIQKWTLATAGGNWAKVATFSSGLTAGPTFLSAKAFGTSVVVLCVTGESAARVVRYVDDGVNLTPTGVTLATGVAATIVYRGVSFPPE